MRDVAVLINDADDKNTKNRKSNIRSVSQLIRSDLKET